MTIEELRELMAIHNRLVKITSKYPSRAEEVHEGVSKALCDAAFMAANSVNTFLDEAQKEYVQQQTTAAESEARRQIAEATQQAMTAGPFQIIGTPVPLSGGRGSGSH